MATNPSTSHQDLLRELHRFGRCRKGWALLEGCSRALLAGPGLLLFWFLLDWALLLPPWPLFLLFAVIIMTGLAATGRWALPPLLRRIDVDGEALTIEGLHGKLDNLLIGALQLGREASAGERMVHSSLLVNSLVTHAATTVSALVPVRLLDLRRARQTAVSALTVVLVAGLLLLAAPDAVEQRWLRLQDAWLVVLDTLFPVDFDVTPGDITVVRGSPVTLSVTVHGARRPAAEVQLTDLESGEATSAALALSGEKATFQIASAEESFSYDFGYGNRRSKRHTVQVGDRPAIAAISYELVYPVYTGQAPRTLNGMMPKLKVLAGTRVMVSLAATTDLHPTLTVVKWQEEGVQAVTVNGRFAHFSFAVDRADRAEIQLTGTLGRGFEIEPSLPLEIAMQKDQAPTIELAGRREKMTLLAEAATLFSLPYTAEDDFGVAEVSLRYRIDTIDAMLGREPREGALTRTVEPAVERANGKFAEAFKGLDPALQPGDRIRVEVVAKDNNTETGPGLGRSRMLEIVVVSPDLAQFTEKQFGFRQSMILGGLKRVGRATNLLVEPERSVRTEKEQKVERQVLDARVNAESWPSGSEDAVGDYFRLLSGGR